MRFVLLATFFGLVGVLWGAEPDLSGTWHRENGAVLEATKDGLGLWTLTLTQAGPQAGAGVQKAVGKPLVTGLKWSGTQWTNGTLRVPGNGKQTFACRLVPLSPTQVQLEVSALLVSRKEVLTR